jgi:hypothetical protein
LDNAQRHPYKVNGAKDAVLFHQHFCQNVTACIKPQLLHRAPYFGTFLPNAVAVKIIRNELRNICSALDPQMLMKLTPGASVSLVPVVGFKPLNLMI